MDVENSYTSLIKLNKTIDQNNQNDVYCFECHQQGNVIYCDSCPRVYHSKCLGLITTSKQIWTCPECEIGTSFNIINQSTYSINDLYMMLKHILNRLKSHPQAEYFLKSIDINQLPKYFDYIIHPMNFEIIEKNLNQKKYHSIEAFISDIKWILHNSFIYHGSQQKLTNIARTFLKITRDEITEIEICFECYLRSIQPMTIDWFTKPCTIPHTLCWVKLKHFQPWPAKVLRIVQDKVDVRFFGQHDRAWISLNNCFILSKEYPGHEKKKSNINFNKSLAELQIHIEQLKKFYGHFTYAPLYTLISKTKPFKFLSIIDDSILPSYITTNAKNNSISKQDHSSILELNKRSNENFYSQSTKRLRFDENFFEKDKSTLNVFDIFNQSEHEISTNNELQIIRSISPTDNKLRIQAFLKKYINCQSSVVEIINPDVRSSMDALLDAVEALKKISEVHTNIPEQQTRIKKPRKSNSQQRIIQKTTNSNFITCSSLDQFLSPSLPFVPLRPLSVSPPSADIFESIPPEINNNMTVELVKSEEEEQQQQTQSSISISPFRISSSLDTNTSLPTIIPNSPCISQISTTMPEENIWPSILSINSSKKQSKNKKSRRIENPSNNIIQSHLVSDIPSTISDQNSSQISNQINDHSIKNEIQITLNKFNDQFQQLFVDLTSQIDTSLRNTRMKYEKDLEEIRQSYRLSLNELHSITTEQVQEIHNSLELQYWKRLSEMRNRYESKLHYSISFH